MQVRAPIIVSLLAGLSLGACGEDGGAPVGPEPDALQAAAAISLRADADTVRVGRTLALTATVLDAAGRVLTGRKITWASSHPLLASVSATGVVTGLRVAPGVSVTASSEGVRGSFTLAVLEDPIASVRIGPAPASIEVQDSTALSVVVLDDLGAEIVDPQVTWTSSDTTVATIDDSAILRGVNGGTLTLHAEAGGLVDSASVSVEVVLRAEAEATDGGPLGGVAFFLETGLGVDSAVVAPDGKVELRTLRPIVGEVSRMYFRAIGDEGMRFLPSLRRAQPIYHSIGDSLLRAMLIPKTVLNADGSPSPVQLSMFLGQYPASDDNGDGQSYARHGLYGNSFTFSSGGWKYSPASWREYPVPVVFNRGFSSVQGVPSGPFPSLEISAADSAAIWAHLDDMNSAMGRRLVVPARWGDFPLDTAWVNGKPIEKPIGAIKVDFPDWSDYPGESRPSSAAAAWPETSWCVDVDCYVRYHETGTAVFYGPGWPGSTEGVEQLDGRLVVHEVIHTLGFGHTCFWPSIMDTRWLWFEFPICRELGTGVEVRPSWGKGYPSPQDVVYINAFIDLVRIYHETKPWFGLWEASEGEREFVHGLPPDVLVTR